MTRYGEKLQRRNSAKNRGKNVRIEFLREGERTVYFKGRSVQLIQDLSSSSQWRYINTAENPANDGSRGMMAKQFVEKSKWLEGLEFLKDSEETWLMGDVVESKVDATDPKAAVTICLSYKKNLKEKAITKKDELMTRKPESEKVEQRLENEGVERVSASSWLSVDELRKAGMEIVQVVQSEAIPAEIKNLKDIQADSSLSNRLSDKKKKAVLKKTNVFHKLDPFVDPTVF
ncbi:Hypothetical predicted protein [Paramuricea clavata]|uniref:Uncharacterized protein n=1 Tax=Paramuricea clavata TaxID=317549 RepID=A0A6S7IHJ2_PARCT|nr:Hypothetical predicted protein [Paramuricea clavata]